MNTPNLTPSPETVEFLASVLGTGPTEHPKVSEMLRSRTDGFFDKARYPVPEDFFNE
jgi:hypothetical protein